MGHPQRWNPVSNSALIPVPAAVAACEMPARYGKRIDCHRDSHASCKIDQTCPLFLSPQWIDDQDVLSAGICHYFRLAQLGYCYPCCL